MSDLFITNEFIDDCADASLTLKLFHARFNRPQAISGQDFSVADYTSDWITQNQSGSTPVIVTGSDFLATYINKNYSSLIVKVPYIAGVDGQLVGYLMYRRYRGNKIVDTREDLRDRVAFVFSIADFGVGIYRQPKNHNTVAPTDSSTAESMSILSENDNDNSYIYIDVSKLNIAASLEPFYNQAKDNTQESSTLWNYVNEHAHDLFGMTYTTIEEPVETNEPNFTLENKQGYFFDASTEKYSAQKTALHFSNKVTALTLPVAIYSGDVTSYAASITSDDYRSNSLIQTTDGRVRAGNLMQTTIDGNIVDPTKVEVDNISDLKVTFNETTYSDYVKKLYVEGHHIDLDDQYLFWNNG